MRKADYVALADIIKKRLDEHLTHCVRDGIIWQDQSWARAAELVLLAESFASVASVDTVAFLDAAGVNAARLALRSPKKPSGRIR